MRDAALIRYRGLMPEKFIKKALDEGVTIVSVETTDAREALIRVSDRDAQRLVALGEKYSLDVKLLSPSRAGKARRAIRSRLSLIPAFVLFIALLMAFSSRVWVIELRIDESDSPEDARQVEVLRNALTALGVVPGMDAGAIDRAILEPQLQLMAPEFAFIGVRVTGIRLLVEAVRELPQPSLYDLDRARDLVADSDAVVLEVKVLSGTASVKPGDTVRRGSTLILGEERVSSESTRGICALGEVVARCWITGEAESSIHETERLYTGRESLSSELRLMDFFYPLTSGETYQNQEEVTRRLPVGGLFLPLNIVSTERREYEERDVPADLEDIKEKIAKIALDTAHSKLPEGCVIVDKWIDYSMIDEDRIRAYAVIEIRRNIAVSRGGLDGYASGYSRPEN